MYFSRMAAAASAVATANAFLVPPSISKAAMPQIDGVLHILNSKQWLSKLECASCPALPDAEASSLVFNITVGDSTPQTLNVNGVPLFPPSAFRAQPMTALQVASDASLTTLRAKPADPEVAHQERRLGYEVLIQPLQSGPSKAEVMSLKFKTATVDEKSVKGVDTVEVDFVRLPDGQMHMVRYGTKPSSDDGKGCTSFPLLCHFKELIKSKLAMVKTKFRGCHMRRPHVRPAVPMVQSPPVAELAEADHHHKSHKSHHGHHFILQAFKRVSLQVLAPILVGIAAGMAASLLGMVVGSLVVMLYRKFYRGKYSRIELTEETERSEDSDTEEHGLMKDEDLPEYEDTETFAVTEKQG